jgi:hypothetical protein
MQAYSNPQRESDPYALPDVEVFFRTDMACKNDGWETGEGWYYWFCFPGCLPDSDPVGPFDTQEEAIADAQQGAEEEL